MTRARSTPGYTFFETALGPCGIAWSEAGLRALELPGEGGEGACAERLATRAGGASRSDSPPPFARDAMARVRSHLDGKPSDLSAVPIDLDGVPEMHRAAYELLRRISPGHTTTYGELARQLGGESKARAVGQAMAKNPFLLVVPCHRVLSAGGLSGGFSAAGGVATKAKLLALEGVRLKPAAAANSKARDGEIPPLFRGAGDLPFDWDEAVRTLSRADRTLGRLIERAPPVRLQIESTHSAFEALSQSIVYQQLNGRAAATIFGRVRALFPRKRFPAPKDLLAMSEDALRGAGLSAAKLRAMRDLAEKSLDGTVPPMNALRAMGEEEIIERLTRVRGIGRWTVEMLLIFRLGRPDVLPVDDYGVRKGFARTYERDEPRPKELLEFGERWRPYRTVASWYFWRATEM